MLSGKENASVPSGCCGWVGEQQVWTGVAGKQLPLLLADRKCL